MNDITVWYAGYNITRANNANLYYEGLIIIGISMYVAFSKRGGDQYSKMAQLE